MLYEALLSSNRSNQITELTLTCRFTAWGRPPITRSKEAGCVVSLKSMPRVALRLWPGLTLSRPGNSWMLMPPAASRLAPTLISPESSAPWLWKESSRLSMSAA